tara:strand:+ start:9 stop:191 length:183 start_codon:yes stop_codon:yes gene_type:complete
MILITIKRNDGSIEKRHVGDDETSVRDVIVSRHLGSVSGSIDDDVIDISIEKISHILKGK